MNLVCLIPLLPVLGPSQQVDYQYQKVAEYNTPKHDHTNTELTTPKYVALVYWLFGAVRTCKTPNAGETFSEPPLSA